MCNSQVKLCTDPCLRALLCVLCSGHCAIQNIAHTISLCAVMRDRLLYRMFVTAVCQCLNNKRILLYFSVSLPIMHIPVTSLMSIIVHGPWCTRDQKMCFTQRINIKYEHEHRNGTGNNERCRQHADQYYTHVVCTVRYSQFHFYVHVRILCLFFV